MKNLYFLKEISSRFSRHFDHMAEILLRIFPESFFGSYKTLKEKMTILYGKERHLEEIHHEKKKLAIRFYILGLAFIILMIFMTMHGYLKNNQISTITRPDPKQDKELHRMTVEMTDKGYTYKENISIHITEREKTEKEIHAAFQASMDRLGKAILKNNKDLLSVYTDLDLYTMDQENGISIRWKSHDESLVNSQGKVFSDNLTKEAKVTLEFELTLEDKKKTGSMDLRILPFMEYASLDEKMHRKLNDLILEISQDRKEKLIYLPSATESMAIRWYEERQDLRGILVIVFGIFLVVFWHTKYRSVNNTIKRNRMEIESEYPNFIAKLVLLLNSGLIFQSSIEKIVLDYHHKSMKKNVFYDELGRIMHNVEESKAYLMEELEEFSKRYGVKEMLRFTVIVKENSTTGDLLSHKLRKEAEQTWRNRKRKAEELGKLAETKLVFPMVILLMVLIAIVMMPALLEMK